jgi:cytochrome P450
VRATGGLELFEGAFWQDPYPAFARLRDEAPRQVELPDGPVWLLTRHADVRAALADPRFSKDWRYTLPPEQRAAAPGPPLPMMILMDPPDHTRLRKLVSRSFTSRRMTALRPRVEQAAAELLDAFPEAGEIDLLESFAFPLPVRVICELLGVPARDRPRFGAWSATMIDQSTPEATTEASTAMVRYLGDLVAEKRRHPDDGLISALIEVSDEGDRLGEDELVAMAMLLLIAGHETTANLIGNAVLGLLTHPDQLALLRSRPDLMPGAVEEFLRWDSPVQSTPVRFLSDEVEVSGTTIPAGSVAMLSLGAANRDDRRFDAADRLRVDRDAGGHVAFGYGLHFCLGAQLARIEGEIAIRSLFDRHPGLALAVDPADVVFRRSSLVRGLTTLPVRLPSA